MHKHFRLALMLISLLLVAYGVLWPGGSIAIAVIQNIPVDSLIAFPAPNLILDQEVANQLATGLNGAGEIEPGDAFRSIVTGSVSEPVTATNTITQPKLTIAIEKPELIKDLNSNQKIDPGDTIRYKITYKNEGDAAATNVTIESDYPNDLIAERGIVNITGEDSDDRAGKITWERNVVKPEDEASLTYDVTLKSKFDSGTASVENKVIIKSGETLLGEAKDTFPITVQPKLIIAIERVPGLIKDLNGDGLINPGDTIRYKITYKNEGDAAATDVTIESDYPETFIANGGVVDISGGGSDDKAGKITWKRSAVEPGDEVSLTYDVTLRSKFDSGTTPTTPVENKVTIKIGATLLDEAKDSFTISNGISKAEVGEVAPTGGIFENEAWLPMLLIGLLTFAAMAVFTYVGAIAKYDHLEQKNKEQYQLECRRVGLVREGVFLIFIVASIMILALGARVESDGAISILSAIVGYVFGRVSSTL